MSVAHWEAKFYPSASSRDAVKVFLPTLYKHVRGGQTVLDIGAGAGRNNCYDLKGHVRNIVGVDFDKRVADNPLLDAAVIAKPGPLPFDACSFDAVFCIYVLEHVSDPGAFVSEVRRILKPGGFFLALTPNRYHYVPLIACLTPTTFHEWLNERRGRSAEDTFPTVYLMNTRQALLHHFADGFECQQLDTIEVEPNYLKFSSISFLLGTLYERLVNRFEMLARLRVNIICVFRKL